MDGKKILFSIKYIGFCFLIFGVPLAIYFFVKRDPLVGEEETSLGVLAIIIPYFIALFLIHKYKSGLQLRTYYLGILVEDCFTREEKKQVKEMLQDPLQERELLESCPELKEAVERRKDEKKKHMPRQKTS